MSAVPVFVPVSRDQARRLRVGEDLGPLTAYSDGPGLREAHGLSATEDEEAGFVALGYAGLAALLANPGLRLVLAADVNAGQLAGPVVSAYGEVGLSELRWPQVQAVFADEPGAAADLDAARTLAGGRDLAEVADDAETLALVDAWDLLWYAPQELDATET